MGRRLRGGPSGEPGVVLEGTLDYPWLSMCYRCDSICHRSIDHFRSLQRNGSSTAVDGA